MTQDTNAGPDTGLLDGLVHTQYHSDGDLVVFRCFECGYASLSLGSLHAHAERHRGYGRFNIQVPFTKTSQGRFGELMKLTEVLRISDPEKINIGEVDGL
jgi:hypothetical protein